MNSPDDLARIFHEQGFASFDLSLYLSGLEDVALQAAQVPDDAWRAVVRNHHGQFDFASQQKRTIIRQHRVASSDLARGRFAYSFQWIDSSHGSPFLSPAKAFLDNEEFRRLLTRITGRAPSAVSQFYLSRYVRGSFLSTHCDPGQSYGIVLNLTHQWNPDHGGLTVILEKDRQHVRACLCPTLFSILIFDTSQRSIPHFVSMVGATAPSPRIALVARFHDEATLGNA